MIRASVREMELRELLHGGLAVLSATASAYRASCVDSRGLRERKRR